MKIVICNNCGCVFCKINRTNPYRCPQCMHMNYGYIEGLPL